MDEHGEEGDGDEVGDHQIDDRDWHGGWEEWRGEGSRCSGPPGKGPPFANYSCPTAAEMAARLNGYKPGTATQIYGTSDGGLHLDNFDRLVPLLAEHVTVVNHNELARMALAAHEEAKRGGARS